jgi:Tn3 transposase DDE domain
MDAAVTHLKAGGMEIKKDDLERLSPLGNKHFNVLGRYHFSTTDAVLRGELRPLRDPEDRIVEVNRLLKFAERSIDIADVV